MDQLSRAAVSSWVSARTLVLLMTELDASSGLLRIIAPVIACVRRQLPFLAISRWQSGAWHQHFARPLVGYRGVSGHRDGPRMRCHPMVGPRTSSSLSTDVDSGAALAGRSRDDEHHAVSGVQQVPYAGHRSRPSILLALGTFLAGVHLLSLQIGFLGVALALAVPAISWVKQSALFRSGCGVPCRARHGVLVLLGRYASSEARAPDGRISRSGKP